jgi:chloride channel protein, CIC family
MVASGYAGKNTRGTIVQQILWALAVGLVSGLGCVALRLSYQGLQWIFTGHSGMLPAAASELPLWRRAITPVVGAGAAAFVVWLSRRFQTTGRFTEYVEAVRLENGRISFAPTCWRTLSSAFSVATGASVGREGSMIQFAAALTSLLRPQLVACGVAAAVAAVYQAPVAGVFFAAEIVIGQMVWNELPFLLISAFAGVAISRPLLGGGPIFAVHTPIGFSFSYLWLVGLAAVLLGALGPVYHRLIQSLQFARKWPLALLWGGAFVGLLSLSRPEVWGNGDMALLHLLQATPAVNTIFLLLALRLAATTFCVGTGTVGGVFTPTLFAGSAIGLLAGRLLHVPDPLLFALLGMACLLAAVTHAPWMAAFMAVELTGQWHLLPLLLLCTLLAWQVARYLSPDSLYALASPEPARDGRMSSLTLWKTFDLKSSV